MWLYFITVFTSAFLLFQIQPLISKYLLPFFGGAFSVWIVCLMFFQLFLVLGYLYSHFLVRFLKVKLQKIVHSGLLVLAFLFLPILPKGEFVLSSFEKPTFQLILILTVSIGLPYLIISATGPLLQTWFAKTFPYKSPYPLYALSNLGSLLALISYPFFIEPFLSLKIQSIVWSILFVFFAVLIVFIIFKLQDFNQKADVLKKSFEKVKKSIWFLWFGLSGCAVLFFMAITNILCLDVASIPFLWIVPLSLYLFSYILAFGWPKIYKRNYFFPVLVICLGVVLYFLSKKTDLGLTSQLIVYNVALFVFCYMCHAELYKIKPEVKYLTNYYLSIALGGAAAGLFVGVLAPMIFNNFYEFEISNILFFILFYFILYKDKTIWFNQGESKLFWFVLILVFALSLIPAVSNIFKVPNYVYNTRNFYGVIKVVETNEDDPDDYKYTLIHGNTQHGFQFQKKTKQNLTTSYYGENSGLGIILRKYPSDNYRKIAVIGLGTGTTLIYGKRVDTFKIYELDPEVVFVAKKYFTYLQNSLSKYEIIIGDARLSMAKEENQNFDIIIVDAFSSDSIPVHLLTKEAFELYFQNLKQDGVLLLHISNRNLNLAPVVKTATEYFGYDFILVNEIVEEPKDLFSSKWAVVTNNQLILSDEEIKAYQTGSGDVKTIKMWTDDYSSLYKIIKK